MKKMEDLPRAILSLAKDSLTDEHGVRNIVTAIYALSESIDGLAAAIANNPPGTRRHNG